MSTYASVLARSYNVFFISISVFISEWFFFMFPISLLNFSLSSSMLLLSSLNILITSVLNSASDRLLVSILFSSFSGVLFYSFIWAMFLRLLILAASLCLFLHIK